ncbi:ArsA family ATPase [Oryzihumus sp.]|uniref:ArsA family ATPase n=1 Tax=Oryzihumus sp. TaxID=1968903 RepID=UPI002EDB520A
MRVLLFTGKGGVGKTTTAAATAVHAARQGIKTLVMSTDAAHSLGDALDVDLTPREASGECLVEVEPGLAALQVSTPHAMRRSWRSVQDYLLGVLATVGVDAVVAEELTSLPGAEEVVALLELRAQVESGRFDLVVVDCAPTAEALRLLALPEALSWHLERLLPAQRGLLRSLRPAAAAAAGLPVPGADVVGAVGRWLQHLREVQDILRAETTSVRLVTTPERVVVAESRRTLTSLSLYGFTVDQVVVNRVFPQPGPEDADPWRASWNRAQQRGLAEVRESFEPLPVVVTPYLAQEPIGVEALADLALVREGDPGAASSEALLAPAAHRGLSLERDGTAYVLSLPLPLVTAAEVDLKRRGDELLVAVGDHRRVLSLPSVLRRCDVTGAGVRDGALRVRFVPDEKVWPQQ